MIVEGQRMLTSVSSCLGVTINFSSLCPAAVKPISSGSSSSRRSFTPPSVLGASCSAHDFVVEVSSDPAFTRILTRYLLEHNHLETARPWRSNRGEKGLCRAINWRCTLLSSCIILIAMSHMWFTFCLSADGAHEGTRLGGNVEPWEASFDMDEDAGHGFTCKMGMLKDSLAGDERRG